MHVTHSDTNGFLIIVTSTVRGVSRLSGFADFHLHQNEEAQEQIDRLKYQRFTRDREIERVRGR
jgi:hypothetical protein